MCNVLRRIALFMILPLVLCSCVQMNDTSAKKHIIDFYDEDDCVSDFSAEESQALLDIFNITIPETEQNAYIHSLARVEGDNSVTYFLNIDGVADYEAFFEANSDAPNENGALILGINQIYGYTGTDYYITYSHFFRKNKNANSDEANMIFEELNNIYT